MTSRGWKRLFLVVCIGPLLIWGFDRIVMIDWVGSIDLDIEFTVADGVSGIPISGAQVEVQSVGGFHAEPDKQEFVLVADASGSARRECRHSMCFGTSSGLLLTDTCIVHLPFWRFRAAAPGYEPSEWVELDVPEYVQQVKRCGRGQAKLVVSVSLQRNRN